MIFRRLKLPNKGQAGFMLIDLIVSLAITGLIGLGASIATAQVLNQTSRNTDYTAASRNAMNAIHWISRDALMAQNIDGWEGFPLTEDLSLSWIGWNNTEYSADYTLDNRTLRRIYSDGAQVTTTVIAANINTDAQLTNCIYDDDDGILTLTVTASVGAGDKVIDVTKVRQITCRPDL